MLIRWHMQIIFTKTHGIKSNGSQWYPKQSKYRILLTTIFSPWKAILIFSTKNTKSTIHPILKLLIRFGGLRAQFFLPISKALIQFCNWSKGYPRISSLGFWGFSFWGFNEQNNWREGRTLKGFSFVFLFLLLCFPLFQEKRDEKTKNTSISR